MADAIHTFTDSIAFGINYAGSRASRGRSATTSADHYFYIGIVTFLSGVWICSDTMATLVAGPRSHPGFLALIVASLSIVWTYFLFLFTRCSYERNKDPDVYVCLIQNKTNFFSACISFVGVLLAETSLMFFDPLCGYLIGAFLVGSSLEVFRCYYDSSALARSLTKRRLLQAVGVLSLCVVGFFAFEIYDVLRVRDVVLIPSHGTASTSQAERLLGRAEYFAVFNREKQTRVVIENKNRHYRGDVSDQFVELARRNDVEVVLAQKIGDEMFEDIQEEGIVMFYFDDGKAIDEVLAEYESGRLDLARSSNVAKGYGRDHVRWLEPW